MSKRKNQSNGAAGESASKASKSRAHESLLCPASLREKTVHDLEKSDVCKEFLDCCFGLAATYAARNEMQEPGVKTCDYMPPEELAKQIDFSISNDGKNLETIINHIDDIMKRCVNTGHRMFFNQLFAKMHPVALAGEVITSVLNSSMYTYELAPVFVLMEMQLLARVREMLGWGAASTAASAAGNGDGLFAPGGSVGNMYAMELARFRLWPDSKEKGVQGRPQQLVAFTSAQSHYSIDKGAILMGLGLDHVWKVACDAGGRMLAADLARQIDRAVAQGLQPFFVNATAGTTVTGAFDPIDQLAAVCRDKGGIWLHVDGAWGASALMSRRHRAKLAGAEHADSLAWCAHKMLGVPLQCSLFVTKHAGLLAQCNRTGAQYLFQKDKQYDRAWDTGDKALQCGRKVDAFKFWLMWTAHGQDGMERWVDTVVHRAHYLERQLVARPEFALAVPRADAWTNVCFYYLPPDLRPLLAPHKDPETGLLRLDAAAVDQALQARLHRVAAAIKAAMMAKGSTLCGYQPLGDLPNFFRMIISSPRVTDHDLDNFLEEIITLSKDMKF